MTLTGVVREDLCVYAGGAWALMGRSLFVGLGGLVSGWLCVGLGRVVGYGVRWLGWVLGGWVSG